MKSYTLRLDSEDQKHIDEIKESFWKNTDSKAIKYALHNFKLTQDVLELKRKECEEKQKEIDRLKDIVIQARSAMSFLKSLGADLD